MRKQNQMKKGIAALLSGVLAFGMTVGVIPGFEDSMQSVRAATSEPSVTAYATKQQMMDGTFATDWRSERLQMKVCWHLVRIGPKRRRNGIS